VRAAATCLAGPQAVSSSKASWRTGRELADQTIWSTRFWPSWDWVATEVPQCSYGVGVPNEQPLGKRVGHADSTSEMLDEKKAALAQWMHASGESATAIANTSG
jgi:hypothetical protein